MKTNNLKQLKKILVDIRNQIPCKKLDTKKAGFVAIGKELHNFKLKQVYEHQFVFNARGCAKGLSNFGPCTMCGFLAETTLGKMIPASHYVKQFLREYAKPQFKKCQIVTMLNSGSLLNDWEFSRKALIKILKLLNKNKNIDLIILETRPQYVTKKKLDQLKSIVPNKELMLTLGIEVKSDFIRNNFINKGFTKKDIERVVNLCKKANVRTHAYILLKPPFLTEAEAIKEAIDTIDYAFKIGIDGGVSIEICGVQKYSLLEWLDDNGMFKPPWLWSVIEVLKATKKQGRYIRLGMGGDITPHLKDPGNCLKCSRNILKKFVEYNKKQDLNIFKGLTCQCKKVWEEELKVKDISFEKRIPRFLKIYGEHKKEYVRKIWE